MSRAKCTKCEWRILCVAKVSVPSIAGQSSKNLPHTCTEPLLRVHKSIIAITSPTIPVLVVIGHLNIETVKGPWDAGENYIRSSLVERILARNPTLRNEFSTSRRLNYSTSIIPSPFFLFPFHNVVFRASRIEHVENDSRGQKTTAAASQIKWNAEVSRETFPLRQYI